MLMKPSTVVAASSVACRSSMLSAKRMSRSGLTRSVQAPAIGARKSIGMRSAAAIMPSQAGDSVSSHASQPAPTRIIQPVV